jgi:hypothetical protein
MDRAHPDGRGAGDTADSAPAPAPAPAPADGEPRATLTDDDDATQGPPRPEASDPGAASDAALAATAVGSIAGAPGTAAATAAGAGGDGGLVGAGAIGGVIAALLAGRPATDPCAGAADRLDRIATAARARAIAGGFAATHLAYAGDTAARVQATVDGYGRAWAGMRIEACRADRARHEPVAERRIACLDQRLTALDAALARATRFDESRAAFGRAIELTRRDLADVQWRAGDHPGARTLAGEALAIYQRAGRRDGAAEITKWLAEHR